MGKDIYSYQTYGNYSYFGEVVPGAIDGIGEGADWNKLAAYSNPALDALENGSSIYISDILTEVSGIPVRFIDGSVASPGASWTNETSSGLYRIGTNDFGEAVDGVHKWGWNATRMRLESGFHMEISNIAQTQIVYGGVNEKLEADANFTYYALASSVYIAGYLEIGSATDASAAGDFSAGTAGFARLFYDQSAETLTIYGSAGGGQNIVLNAAGDSWYNGTGNFGFGTVSPDQQVEVESATSFQIRLSYLSGTYTDIGTQSDGDLFINPLSGVITHENFPLVSGGDIELWVGSFDDAGGDTILHLRNYDNAAGDCLVRYKVGSGSSYFSAGMDNTDDSYRISRGQDLGTTDWLVLSTNRQATFTPAALSSGTAYALQLTGQINTGGTNGLLKVLGGASTGQTTLTEIKLIDFDLSATVTWATGAISNQRCFTIEAPTLAFAGASTVTNAATVYIDRAPQVGTNATITNAYALWVDDGAVRFDGAVSGASFTISGLTATRVTFAGTGGILTDDADFTFTTASNSLALGGYMNIGTATDAAAQGDFAVGLTGAGRIFFDQSIPALYLYNSSGTIVNQLSGVASTATVFNEQGADIDFRVEGDTNAFAFFVDASVDTVLMGASSRSLETRIQINKSLTDISGSACAVYVVPALTTTTTNANTAFGMLVDASSQISISSAQTHAGWVTLSNRVFRNTAADAGTLTTMIGEQMWVGHFTASNASIVTTTATGLQVGMYNGVGTITTFLGLDIVDSQSGGTTTTSIGIRVDPRDASSATNTTAIQTLNGNIDFRPLATQNFIWNENGVDGDFRVESDDEAYCLMVEGTLNNVVMCANTEPGFNSMDGGVFLAEANVVPTGNPTAGVYIYVEGGALKCRGTGGTITTMGPA